MVNGLLSLEGGSEDNNEAGRQDKPYRAATPRVWRGNAKGVEGQASVNTSSIPLSDVGEQV